LKNFIITTTAVEFSGSGAALDGRDDDRWIGGDMHTDGCNDAFTPDPVPRGALFHASLFTKIASAHM